MRQEAIQQLDALLRQDPGQVSALLALGAIRFGLAGALEIGETRTVAIRQAQDCYQRILKIEPGTPMALYRLGMLGWLRVYPELQAARTRLGMDPDDPAPLRDAAVRSSLNALYGPEIASAMAHLERLVAADPECWEALNYLNLLFRAKAELEETADAACQDIAFAEQLVQKALLTSRVKVERAAANRALPPPDLRFDSNGKVRFVTTVKPGGVMEDLVLVSGHPSLLPAAREAVKHMNLLPTRVPGWPFETGPIIEVDFASE